LSSNVLYGYAGKVLRVDLTNERLTEEVLDEATLRKWVGGVGIGVMYLDREVPAGVSWDDPENRLIVSTGPLAGTRMGGSGTICINTKGCLTNGGASSQANGFMGAYMKFSGYDAVVFHGAARRWVYLYLHDGKAELREAAHLIGKDTWQTEDAIKQELGFTEKAMSVYCIGPAGENQVRFAGIFGDKDHCAAHNGMGAVMGSKKLKAFCAARGSSSLRVKAPEQVSAAAKAIWDGIRADPQGKRVFEWGTGGSYQVGEERAISGTLPVKNYTTTLYPEARLITSQHTRETWNAKRNPCWACQMHHCHMVTFSDGPYAGRTVEEPEYEMYAAWGPLIGNTDPAEILILSNLLTLLGLEGNEAGFLVSMVMELYEKGVLTREQTDGLDLNWGNTKAVATLLERISRREGAFAAMLAAGTVRAAEALGEEARQCGIYTFKGHSPRGHDHRSMWHEMFDTATSDMGTCESGYFGPADPDVPSLSKKFSPEDVSTYVARTKGRRQFEDALGTCTFCTRRPLAEIVGMLNAVTGWDFTPGEAKDVGFRVANLMRVFNLRHGLNVDTERPSARWSSAPADGPAKGVSIAGHWEGMLDNYYKQMGWDRKTGKPLPETLKNLGLESAVAELWGQSISG